MAFAFPAYHRAQLILDQPGDWRAPVISTMQNLRWTVGNALADPILASTGMSLASYSETIEVWIEPNGILTINSKCAMPTQCVDWGKNRRNVEYFIAELERMIGRKLARAS